MKRKQSNTTQESQANRREPEEDSPGHDPGNPNADEAGPTIPSVDDSSVLKEIISHLRDHRSELKKEWKQKILDGRLLSPLGQEEIQSEIDLIYDNYTSVLETGNADPLKDYVHNLSDRIVPCGVEINEVIGLILHLRDTIVRSLRRELQDDLNHLELVIDLIQPRTNHITTSITGFFVDEREKVIQQQQEAIRQISTPVLQVREQLLILPIIGAIDSRRANQLTDQLLHGIRDSRAKVVVIDITGVPEMDSTVANHIVQTVEASRLMGAYVIITGLSSKIAKTLVTIGLNLGKLNTVGDLQSGIELAEKILEHGPPGRATSSKE